ncbi:MAG: rhamnulokinase [Firmicutes bacterium]|nr:rhamnulokinase [Lachnospiraceae bacterium]MBQ7058282.1 rhamnulokinase [Bacillota bacterium]
MKHYYLAIDLGASSGRHVVGWEENGKIQTEEVYRFPNGMQQAEGHLIWDVDTLLTKVKEGIRRAQARFGNIYSLSVDGWGVDYALLRGEDTVFPVYAYRDSRTEAVIPQVHEKIPFSELYQRTGIQFEPFNTIYQLVADKQAGRLKEATDFLMLPEYILFRLCGEKTHEYTEAKTTGLIDFRTGEYDPWILKKLYLPKRLFGSLRQPGELIGSYEGIKVMLCASHDTASAVEGIPMEGNHPYISSGTWSLIGVKTDHPIVFAAEDAQNWSNEGGVGYNRYQKTVMGMWMVNRLRDELCPGLSFQELVKEAETSRFTETVDVNSPSFFSPQSMKKALEEALGKKPRTLGDYFACAYRSIALSYSEAIRELEKNTKTGYDRLYIVGGGAKNFFLNQLTEELTGKKVLAYPIEASALGNLKIQMQADDQKS